MESMTGFDVGTCPWLAFTDEFVQRVNAAVPFFESGQLAFHCVDPSHRLVQGIGFFQQAGNRMQGKQLELESEKRKREMAAAEAARTQGGGHGR